MPSFCGLCPLQLTGLQAELDCQAKLADQYKASLDTVQQIHCRCQEEGGRLRSQLHAKETDLARVMTAMQVASSQVGGIGHVTVK